MDAGMTSHQMIPEYSWTKQRKYNRPHTCPNCGKSYTWKETLMRHMRLECGKVPNIRCPLCPMKFKRKDQLQSHMNSKRHSGVASVFNTDPLQLPNRF